MTMRVLLTGIGGDIAQNVAVILKEIDDRIFLVGTDIYERHGGMAFVDLFEKIPRADAQGYTGAIQAIIKKYDIDTVFPLTEPELGRLSELESLPVHVQWITAGSNTIANGLDKLRTIRSLAAAGIPVPWTIPVSDGPPKDYPCILKSRLGSGSRNIFVVKSSVDAEFYAERYPDSVFQELLEPEIGEVTCAVYRKRSGETYVLQMLRKLIGGLTGWAKIINDSSVDAMCRQVAVAYDLVGSMNVQLRLTEKGPRIFEINPRVSSTALMRHRAGFTDVCWSILDVNGEPFEYSPIPVNTVLIRRSDALVLEP